MKKLLLLSGLSIILFTSCSTQRAIGNGAYSDISLQRSSNQYSLKRLPTVKSKSKAIFGIPLGNVAKKEGIVVRFNGINLTAQQKFLPAFSMAVLTVATGGIIHGIIDSEINDEALGYVISGVGAIPIAGAINNQLWSNAAYSRASWNANSELLDENPDIDIFLNPKYQIITNNGIWSQKVELKADVMGARITTDE